MSSFLLSSVTDPYLAATDMPTESVLERRPEPKSMPLITLTMWKMIIGQTIYQLIVTLVLFFKGNEIFHYGHDAMETVVFNTFVWMQIFNQYKYVELTIVLLHKCNDF